MTQRGTKNNKSLIVHSYSEINLSIMKIGKFIETNFCPTQFHFYDGKMGQAMVHPDMNDCVLGADLNSAASGLPPREIPTDKIDEIIVIDIPG